MEQQQQQSTELAPTGPPNPNEWEAMRDQAAVLARTQLVPKHFQEKPDDIVVVMLSARELRMPPMQALQEIHVIDGKPGLSAKAMMALVLRAGHDIWLEPSSNEQFATCYGRRAGVDRVDQFTFTLDDARSAGLIGRQMWTKYPKAMLKARAVAGLCRQAFPDVLMGFAYLPEEIENMGAETEMQYVPALPPIPDEGLPGVHAEWIERLLTEYDEQRILQVAQDFNAARKLTSLHDLEDMPVDMRVQLARALAGGEHMSQVVQEDAPPVAGCDEHPQEADPMCEKCAEVVFAQ